jgi:hypothetical protein
MGQQMFTMTSIVSDDLVQSVGQQICERWRFTIPKLACEFPQISRTLLYEIIIVRLGYHNFAKNGFRNAHTCAQNAKNGFGFDFFYIGTTNMVMNFSITSEEMMKPGFHL